MVTLAGRYAPGCDWANGVRWSDLRNEIQRWNVNYRVGHKNVVRIKKTLSLCIRYLIHTYISFGDFWNIYIYISLSPRPIYIFIFIYTLSLRYPEWMNQWTNQWMKNESFLTTLHTNPIQYIQVAILTAPSHPIHTASIGRFRSPQSDCQFLSSQLSIHILPLFFCPYQHVAHYNPVPVSPHITLLGVSVLIYTSPLVRWSVWGCATHRYIYLFSPILSPPLAYPILSHPIPPPEVN